MSKKSADIWIPFYIADYLRKTMRLSTLAHGAYMLLLMDYWTSGGPLPDDDDAFAAVTKMSLKDWMKMRQVLGKMPFFDVRDGFWHQNRADEELQKRAGISVERSEAGKRGAEGKWGNKKKANGMANGNANRMANANQNGQQTDGQSQSQSQEEDSSDDKSSSPVAARRGDVEEAFAKFNQLAGELGLPVAQSLNKARRAGIRKRLDDDGGMEAWDAALRAIRNSPHCCGENNRNWRANLDFVIQPSSYLKLLEGVYGGGAAVLGRPDLFAGPSAGGAPEERPEVTMWRVKVQNFRKTGYWGGNDGPAPGLPFCDVPKPVLEELGYG